VTAPKWYHSGRRLVALAPMPTPAVCHAPGVSRQAKAVLACELLSGHEGQHTCLVNGREFKW
jgi:hypothetical protein